MSAKSRKSKQGDEQPKKGAYSRQTWAREAVKPGNIIAGLPSEHLRKREYDSSLRSAFDAMSSGLTMHSAKEGEVGMHSFESWLHSMAPPAKAKHEIIKNLLISRLSHLSLVKHNKPVEPEDDYVDPILFAEGIYENQADYEHIIDDLADRINKGLALPKGREPKFE
jgi:hypothetical protein